MTADNSVEIRRPDQAEAQFATPHLITTPVPTVVFQSIVQFINTRIDLVYRLLNGTVYYQLDDLLVRHTQKIFQYIFIVLSQRGSTL